MRLNALFSIATAILIWPALDRRLRLQSRTCDPGPPMQVKLFVGARKKNRGHHRPGALCRYGKLKDFTTGDSARCDRPRVFVVSGHFASTTRCPTIP